MKSDDDAVLHIKVVCTDLPGRRFADALSTDNPVKANVHLGIQRGKTVIDVVPADEERITFAAEFRVARKPDGKPNFLGPYAHGTPADRFFYLSWGDKQPGGELVMFRRLKVRLGHLTWTQIDRSIETGKPITVTLRLTDERGGPLCATPPASHVKWTYP